MSEEIPNECPKCGRDTYIKMKVKKSDLSFDETERQWTGRITMTNKKVLTGVCLTTAAIIFLIAATAFGMSAVNTANALGPSVHAGVMTATLYYKAKKK